MTDTELDAGGIVDNTPEAWGDLLRRLADEARADAAQRDTSLVLTEQLDDLARVLDTYAVRLTGVERLPAQEASGIVTPEATEAEAAAAVEHMRAAYLDYAAPHIEFESNQPAPPVADLPGWIRATLDEHYLLISNLLERVARLEGSLADALNRIAWLENNIGLSDVTAAPSFEPSILDTPENPDDYNPDSWGSIDRAQEALRRQVLREHARLARMRQQVLNAVVALTAMPELTDDDRAQLTQHRARADRLDQIDVVRDAKLDEIANLRDLTEAKGYQTFVGWPR